MNASQDLIRERICESGMLLDRQDYDGYLRLFTSDSTYRVDVEAPEVAKPMSWMLLSRPEMQNLLQSAHRHVWNTGRRHHMISVERVQADEVSATTAASFCIFRTASDGVTSVFAVGRYLDCWRQEEGEWRLAERKVHLETRMLSPPSAIPL